MYIFEERRQNYTNKSESNTINMSLKMTMVCHSLAKTLNGDFTLTGLENCLNL